MVCSVVDEFSIDERSFNLLKLELEHIQHYDFIGVDELLSNFPRSTVNINLERLMEHISNPFWEDFIEEELIEVNKRCERVILCSLCGGGNMKFIDACVHHRCVEVKSVIHNYYKSSTKLKFYKNTRLVAKRIEKTSQNKFLLIIHLPITSIFRNRISPIPFRKSNNKPTSTRERKNNLTRKRKTNKILIQLGKKF